MHKTTNHRTPAAIVARLIVLVKPMLPIMAAAIVMGVAGHFCATFITIFGGFAILTAAGLQSPLPTVGTAFGCILVFALLRGVLRYAEQASNHYIAFRLLALIRDKVFGALRRLTPAKLEGRDRGDLISLITADIEALEVFYAHTISPVCIAVLWAAGMTAFTAHWHILPALALLAGYLLVGAALPVWSAKRGQAVAREYRQALADTNSYVLESLRGLRDTLQYQDTAARAAGITAHSETLGAKQTALKYREGLIVAVTNTLILFTTLTVLGVSLWLYQRGELAAQGVLVCTLTALSSFGPVVALANLGAGLTQVFASADRVLALLDEAPVTPEVTDGENTPFAGAEVRGVSFGYAGEQVLREISLTIPEKKIVGITAHSETLGAKQTALKYREGLIVAVTNTLILFTTLAVLGVSLWLYQRGALAAQGVLVCTLTALSSFGPVVALANLGAGLTQVFASADRVLALLDEAPVTPEVTDGENTPFAGAEVRGVSFGYAGEQVLREISLTIPEKKIVGITGRSGSGKSTLLRLLMRFWDVQTGSIRFGAEDIRRVNTAALRAQESLVTQETELFADTIGNNIRIAKHDAAQEEVEAACKKAALDDFIRSLPKGYDTPVGELGGTLSGGERQRIGVARAFLHDAPFLLLDEPTSNLDSLNEGIILRAVRAECKDRTVLLVSHRKSTMAAADVSFSVESGRVS